MTGIVDLAKLCRQMTPRLANGVYVYCTFSDFRLPAGLDPVCTFREAEGLTAIIGKGEADEAALPYVFPCRLITLAVHSSLEAVGFLACVTARLSEAGIACNAVAAFHHDHLFVPEARAEETLQILRELASEGSSD
jgi:uncharacterized protein